MQPWKNLHLSNSIRDKEVSAMLSKSTPLKEILSMPLMWLLTGTLLLRIFTWSDYLLGGDSYGYAIGGLGTWIAHPPGFFGYCIAGWTVNQVIANINDSLILINVITSLAGIVFCYLLANSFSISKRSVLLATAAYALSINLSYFSVVALSYAPEGMFATLTALLCRHAITKRSMRFLMAASFVWAISGAFRQTTISFMAPLMFLTVFASGKLSGLIPRLIAFALVSMPVVAAYTKANNHYLAASVGDFNADVSKGFWELQVMMPSNYDQSKLGLDTGAGDVSNSTYHWPFMEVLQWVDEKLNLQILPDYRDFGAGTPQLDHAVKLASIQFLKQSFYLLLSLPAVILVLLLVLRPSKWKTLLQRDELLFFGAWLIPVGGFFVVGHLGAMGYLQIYLSGVSLLLVILLERLYGQAQTTTTSWITWQKAHLGLTALGLAFFLFATPYRSENPREKLLDVVALQHTASSIRQHYQVARSTTNKPGPATIEEWTLLATDREIVEFYSKSDKNTWSIYKIKAVR